MKIYAYKIGIEFVVLSKKTIVFYSGRTENKNCHTDLLHFIKHLYNTYYTLWIKLIFRWKNTQNMSFTFPSIYECISQLVHHFRALFLVELEHSTVLKWHDYKQYVHRPFFQSHSLFVHVRSKFMAR